MRTITVIALCVGIAASAAAVGDETGQRVSLTLTPKGAHEKTGYFMPLGVELVAAKPTQITKAPDDLKSPRYGVIKLGELVELGRSGEVMPRDPKATIDAAAPEFAVILDEPEGQPTRLLIDTNRDGDLTNDEAPEWAARPEPTPDGKQINTYVGKAPINLGQGDTPRTAYLGLFKFDKGDSRRAHLANHLVIYRDYLASGSMKLGDRTVEVQLSDDRIRGDFRGLTPPAKPADPQNGAPADAAAATPDEFRSGVMVLIDVNGNGRIDFKGEAYDVREPFNIGGTTYELNEVAADGSGFTLVKSSQKRDEIKPPPDHVEGKKITAFEATLTDGKKVKFPEDYKGKLVLLDFWATWCGPCMMEVPNVVAAYEKFHGKGFEVLGVSLDGKEAADKLKQVTTERKMVWPQIFEGKGWESSLVDLYAVTGIPACWLVDGDTGMIVAEESRLRGSQLSETVEAELKKKGRLP